MLVISLALVAVLVASNRDDDAAASHATALTATPETPPSAPTDTTTPDDASPDPSGSGLPPELQVRVDALPQKLRDEALAAYEAGSLALPELEQLLADYENRNPAVRVGSVLGAEDGQLRFEIYTTGEQVGVAILPETEIRRAETPIAFEDLMLDELVMVVSTEDGSTALSIEAFGVIAPE